MWRLISCVFHGMRYRRRRGLFPLWATCQMVFCFFTGFLLYTKDGEEALSSLFRVKETQDMKLLHGELRFKAGPSDYFHYPQPAFILRWRLTLQLVFYVSINSLYALINRFRIVMPLSCFMVFWIHWSCLGMLYHAENSICNVFLGYHLRSLITGSLYVVAMFSGFIFGMWLRVLSIPGMRNNLPYVIGLT